MGVAANKQARNTVRELPLPTKPLPNQLYPYPNMPKPNVGVPPYNAAPYNPGYVQPYPANNLPTYQPTYQPTIDPYRPNPAGRVVPLNERRPSTSSVASNGDTRIDIVFYEPRPY